MSRARAVLVLAAAALAAAIALELPWISAAGSAQGASTSLTVSLSGAAALPVGLPFVLLLLITLVGTWVLPWWLRIVLAASTLTLSIVVAFMMVRFLVHPDISAIVANISTGDAVSEQWHFAAPMLLLLALLLSTWALRGVLVSARSWPGLAPRYDRGAGADPWSQMDRGIDPTDDR